MVVCALPGADVAARASGTEIVTRRAACFRRRCARTRCPHGSAKTSSVLPLALGPGLGRSEGTQLAVRQIVAECPIPLVVDADALNTVAVDHTPLLDRSRRANRRPSSRLTRASSSAWRACRWPPIGCRRHGFRRGTGGDRRPEGPGTVIAAPDGNAIVNRSDSPALGAAGTGDVLTGMIAGFLAAGAKPFAAAASAVAVHGMAARAAGTGNELVATDVVDALPRTLDALRAGHEPESTRWRA